MVLMAVPMIVMYELSIIIARYVNPTTEVITSNALARDEEPDQDGESDRSEDHEENGHERDL
jgi:Sec-independent protein secretion pathway component TatC